LIANTVALREWLRRERGLDLPDYESLRAWSVANVDDFWAAMWDHFDLQSSTPRGAVRSGATMPDVHWFAGTQLNYVSQIARRVPALDAAGVPAVIFRNERLQREGRSVQIGWHARRSAPCGA
jgi:acetoacetyl-CoA synthetase